MTRAGLPVPLSPTEFDLLRVLMEHAGQVLSTAQLLELVWRYDFGGDDSIVASYVRYLRRKVDDREPKLIHTVRGIGYVLRRPPVNGTKPSRGISLRGRVLGITMLLLVAALLGSTGLVLRQLQHDLIKQVDERIRSTAAVAARLPTLPDVAGEDARRCATPSRSS